MLLLLFFFKWQRRETTEGDIITEDTVYFPLIYLISYFLSMSRWMTLKRMNLWEIDVGE